MELEGSHTFDAPRDRVWELLNDPDVLIRLTTGLKRLDPEGDDSYRATFQIKMGPIDSSFKGTMKVVDKVAPESYALLIDVDARIGVVSAKGTIHLEEIGPQTLLNFGGRAELSGKLAQLGQRVMSGVGKHFTQQFFKSLEKELASGEVTEQEVKS
jgi:carbon monoxide dehydrogenase subunit G